MMSWMIHKMEVSLSLVNFLSQVAFPVLPKELHSKITIKYLSKTK